MNDLPPKITPSPGAPSVPKSPKPLAQKHVMLGVAGGFVAGAILATVLWITVGMLFYHGTRMEPQASPIESSLAPVPIEFSEASDKATIAEIDAAAQLSFENSKLSLFDQIAVRPNLSPAAQVHLVEMAFRHLSFEQNQMQLLLKIIANPAFSPAAKERILKDVSRISFENNKQAILEAMNRRETQR